MKFQGRIHTMARRLVSASCLSLLIAWQAFAASPIQQPNSVTTDAVPTVEVTAAVTAAQDAAVTPAGCCDSGCDSCGGGSGCCGNNGCCGGSCCCDAVCCPKKVTEEVKKHYWEVKSEMVCIPGFRFECNWNKNKCCKSKGCGSCGCADTCCSNDTCCSDSCSACCKPHCEKCPCKDPGTPTCGRVRCINVLEKHDYTCDECGYEWEVKCVRSGRGTSRCGKGGCCCPKCGCASTEAVETDVQLTSATEAATPTAETTAAKPSLSRRLMGWLK